jgi:multiple sugar transport system substrate-binding protein
MKRLFATILAILALASVYTWRTLPGAAGDDPVLYWVTDPNPARAEQIRTFKQWLRKTYPEAPNITIRVDTANTSPEKVLVQGVSGVCADLIDHTGGPNLRFRKSVGLLEDLTEDAARMGFGLDKTFPAIAPELVAPVKTVDAEGRATYVERQFAFPCNVTAEMLWVNREAFAKAGLEPPARRWTVDEFERVGREFVLRANPTTGIQRIFFIADVQPLLLANSAGGCLFNETATAPAVNSRAMADAFKLRHRWTFESPRLLPTSSERRSFAASSGYGGAGLAMFAQGNYALNYGGRYLLIQFRKISDERIAAGGRPMDLAISEMPHWAMPISKTFTRATAIYAGGRQKDLAKSYLACLASEDYNRHIGADGDSLPPDPRYSQTEAFRHPKDRPDEWGVHAALAEAMETIAVPGESSPFVIDDVVNRLLEKAQDYHINNLKTAEQALADLEREMAAEIQRSLDEDPDLLPLYQARLATQAKIDDLRARGEKVPLSLISNPYHRRWYVFNGWADPEN